MVKLLGIALVGLLATTASATRIADVTRLGGQRTNVLTGMGLVVGLKGTVREATKRGWVPRLLDAINPF